MKKLLLATTVLTSIVATPVLALDPSSRAVEFDGFTFLHNSGYANEKLWPNLTLPTDIVQNFWSNIPGTLTVESNATLINAQSTNSKGIIPVYRFRIINKNGLGAFCMFAGDLDHNIFHTCTYPGSVPENGRWDMLTVMTTLRNKSPIFPYYLTIFMLDSHILDLDPNATATLGKQTSIHVPWAFVNNWTIGALYNPRRADPPSNFYEGKLSQLFLISWPGVYDLATIPNAMRGSFGVVNTETLRITPNYYGPGCTGPFGWPGIQGTQVKVRPGICEQDGPAGWYLGQSLIDKNAEFTPNPGHELYPAASSPFDEIQ